jgi:hypothetical protein
MNNLPFQVTLQSLPEVEKKEIGGKYHPSFSKKKEAFVLFGFGDSANLLQMMKKKPKALFFIIETDLTRLAQVKQHAVHTLCQKKSVHLFHISSMGQAEDLIKGICMRTGHYPYQLLALEEREKDPIWQKIKQLFPHIHMGVSMSMGAFADLGEMPLHHLLTHIAQVKRAGSVADWTGAFEGMPAIILGAGLSLNQIKDPHMLDGALVFAGGKAIELAERRDYPVHVMGAIDSSFCPEIQRGEIPFFIQGSAAPKITKKYDMPFFFTGQDEMRPFETELLKKLFGDLPYFDSGWHVGNFLTSVACFMGCDPIIFVGQDLCFKEQYYASGGKVPREEWIQTVNIRGDKVMTKKDFLISKDWIERLASRYKGKFYALGDEGLAIYGVPSIDSQTLSQLCTAKSVTERMRQKMATVSCHPLDETKKAAFFNQLRSECETLMQLIEKEVSSGNIHVDLSPYLVAKALADPYYQVWQHMIFKELLMQNKASDKEMAIQKLLFTHQMAERCLQSIKKAESLLGCYA